MAAHLQKVRQNRSESRKKPKAEKKGVLAKIKL